MKRKILLISLLTLVVLGVGVVYVSKILHQKPIARWSYDEYRIDDAIAVSSDVDIAGVSKGKRAKQRTNTRNAPSATVSTKTTADALGSTTSGTSSRSLRNGGSYAVSSRNQKRSALSGSSGLLYPGRLAGGSSSSLVSDVVSGGGIGTSIGAINQSFAVPITDDGIVLVDPGTEPIKENQIPVGNGVWVMFFMLATYGFVRFRK